MEKPPFASAPVRFGLFEVDLRAGELRKQGVKIKLQEQPLQILAMLLEHPGQVITREELRTRLWPADTFVDFDHSLNKAMNKLREALGDSAESPRFIETLPRRGYRLITALDDQIPKGGTPIDSIAVLPFSNLTTDPENELFADGMCEEIIASLARIRNLHVVARTSSFSFKGKYVDARTVGQQLNVRTLLEGSVRRSGGRLRITAQLVDVANGYHLWSQRYDREVKDMFAIQEEIAHSIAETLEVSLDSDAQSFTSGGTNNVEAFKFYVRGRGFLFQRGQRLLAAVDCLKKAVTLDPGYALAWSGLADAYHMSGFYGLTPPEACMPHGKDAAHRAILLDPTLAEAHASLAMSYLLHDCDRSSAERSFMKSLELKPHNSVTRSWYGLYYLHWAAGRFEDALTQTKHAVLVDPLSPYARALHAFAFLPIDPCKSLEVAKETLQLDSDSFLGHWAQLASLNLLGRLAEAAEVGERALPISGRSAWFMGALARTYAALGRRADAESLYRELLWRSKREYVDLDVLGWAAWAVGDYDDAIRFEQQAADRGDPSFIVAKYWPDFCELRQDPRFKAILVGRGWT